VKLPDRLSILWLASVFYWCGVIMLLLELSVVYLFITSAFVPGYILFLCCESALVNCYLYSLSIILFCVLIYFFMR